MTERLCTCSQCTEPADRVCPRCDQPLCQAHEVPPWASLCLGCEALVEQRVRSMSGARITVVAGAAVGGMLAGAVAILAAATALGLAPEIVVLFMLLGELGVGGAAAVVADRRMHHRLRGRAMVELGSVPRARLLPGKVAE